MILALLMKIQDRFLGSPDFQENIGMKKVQGPDRKWRTKVENERYTVWIFFQSDVGPKTDSSMMEAYQKKDPCQVSSL